MTTIQKIYRPYRVIWTYADGSECDGSAPTLEEAIELVQMVFGTGIKKRVIKLRNKIVWRG